MKSIAIIAGEASGDILGSRLITALKQHIPDLHVEGIGGAEMQKAGCDCLYPMEKLAVMGFIEPLGRLPELLRIRRTLIKRWTQQPPDLVIGIDAPDFNLHLEAKLHQAGLNTVHYVSPSVWAWRAKRVKKMQGNIDLMLTLFPFEVEFYRQHDIPAECVGHPLADEIPLTTDSIQARKKLGLPEDANILAILPGSRSGEIQRLAPDFIAAAKALKHQHPELLFVSPMINDKIKQEYKQICQEIAPDLPITLINRESRTVMAASDIILMASGTAVLEGLFVGRFVRTPV